MIGLAALLLTLKAFYFGGLYDTWASGGGDIRTIKDSKEATALSSERGLSRIYEPVLYMRPIDQHKDSFNES